MKLHSRRTPANATLPARGDFGHSAWSPRVLSPCIHMPREEAVELLTNSTANQQQGCKCCAEFVPIDCQTNKPVPPAAAATAGGGGGEAQEQRPQVEAQ